MEVGRVAVDSLEEQLVDEDGLGRDGHDLRDSVDDVDTARDGLGGVEEAHGDGEAAVDVEEEHSEVQEKQVHCVVLLRSPPLTQLLDFEESNNCCEESKKIDIDNSVKRKIFFLFSRKRKSRIL